jgi:hypothetical protein
MPSVLREHQHELNLPDAVEDGFVFGTEDTGYLTLERPKSTAGDIRGTDRERAQEDGVAFGIEFRGAKTVTFEIGVITDQLDDTPSPYRANLDYLDALEVLWNHPQWRNSPDALAMLRSREAGQTWRCYGRPRRYEEVVGKLTASGYSTVVADFALIESSWYSDVESTADVYLPAGIAGGLQAPFTAPLSSVQATSGSRGILVGGSKDTWPVIEFTGPVAYPVLRIGDMIVSLRLSINAGDTVVFDPRPWVRAVYDKANPAKGYGGAVLSPTPRMVDCKIAPGEYEVTLTGVDTGGGGYARVRWRNARARP